MNFYIFSATPFLLVAMVTSAFGEGQEKGGKQGDGRGGLFQDDKREAKFFSGQKRRTVNQRIASAWRDNIDYVLLLVSERLKESDQPIWFTFNQRMLRKVARGKIQADETPEGNTSLSETQKIPSPVEVLPVTPAEKNDTKPSTKVEPVLSDKVIDVLSNKFGLNILGEEKVKNESLEEHKASNEIGVESNLDQNNNNETLVHSNSNEGQSNTKEGHSSPNKTFTNVNEASGDTKLDLQNTNQSHVDTNEQLQNTTEDPSGVNQLPNNPANESSGTSVREPKQKTSKTQFNNRKQQKNQNAKQESGNVAGFLDEVVRTGKIRFKRNRGFLTGWVPVEIGQIKLVPEFDLEQVPRFRASLTATVRFNFFKGTADLFPEIYVAGFPPAGKLNVRFLNVNGREKTRNVPWEQVHKVREQLQLNSMQDIVHEEVAKVIRSVLEEENAAGSFTTV